MSERLYKTQAGSYYTIWNDSSQQKPQKSEGLKTKNKKEARSRLHTLEMLYNAGYHKPFDTVWHKNKRIKHYVYSGDLTKIDLAQGNIVSGVSLSEAIEEYVRYKIEHRHWGENSASAIKGTLRLFGNEFSINIDNLNESHLHSYLKSRSDSYRETFMRRFNTFSKWCFKKGYINEEPEYSVRKAQVKVPEIITNDTLKFACYKSIEKIRRTNQKSKTWHSLGWLFLRLSGLRPHELMSLKPGDIGNGRILVGGSFTTKTRSQRFVDIQKELEPVIDVLLSNKFREVLYDNDYLFGRTGKGNQNYLADRWKIITDTKLYTLKDTYGFWIITKKDQTQNFNLIYLRDQFGHSSLETTEKYLKYAPKGDVIESLHDFNWLRNFLDEVNVILNK